MLKGIGASGGIGIGSAVIIKEADLSYSPREIEDVPAELERYRNAVEEFCSATEVMAQNLKASASEKEADILTGHILMIQDPYMNGEIEKRIQNGQCAESALESVCDMFISMFSAADDELTNQRAADVRDVKTGILRLLLGMEETDISALPAGSVLVAKELTPSMTAGIKKENIAAILTEEGGKTSHSAILARALEIPAVLSIKNICTLLSGGQQVIADGTEGEVLLSPSDAELKTYTEKREVYLKEREELKKYIGKETKTADGVRVELAGNIGTPEDAVKVMECDGEGVGLFRTEFLFMDREQLPTEEEQFEAYKKAALTLKGKPLIIRTLDIGGDKDIPYMGLEKEENPFLGFRAVRFCLRREDIYLPQLRAILRASAYGDVRIMVPLVTCLEELTSVKKQIAALKQELTEKNVSFDKNIKIGVMIETPAASLIADLLAQEADFFSIGTNDLTGYTMAVDRGNKNVAYLYSPFHPAVLRSIEHIIHCGKKEHIPVGMCGEAAADPKLIPLLLAFGLDEFSVTATSVLETRKNISKWTMKQAHALKEKVMALKTEKEVTDFLKEI